MGSVKYSALKQSASGVAAKTADSDLNTYYAPESGNEYVSAAELDFKSIHTWSAYGDLDSGYSAASGRGFRRDRRFAGTRRTTHSFGLAPNTQHSDEGDNELNSGSSVQRSMFETLIIVGCYLMIAITLPFSLIPSIKFVQSFERLVIFRLGRLQRAKGPGTCFILPCIDSVKRVDVRQKAFNVPPIQAVTQDNGIVELGATVYYQIKDAVAAVLSVKDWNQSARHLAHTALHRHVNKLRANHVPEHRKTIAQDLKEELNKFTFSWGMEVTELEVSEVKVLKEGVSPAVTVMKTLFRPEVRNQLWQALTEAQAASGDLPNNLNEPGALERMNMAFIPTTPDDAGADGVSVANGFLNFLGGAAQMRPIEEQEEQLEEPLQRDAVAKNIEPDLISLTSQLSQVIDGQTTTCCDKPDASEASELTLDIDKLLLTLERVIDDDLCREVGYKYEVHCEKVGAFYMDLSKPPGYAAKGPCPDDAPADVVFKLNADTLLQLLLGGLSPLDAYLSGRLSMRGDTGKAMKLQSLAAHAASKLQPPEQPAAPVQAPADAQPNV